MKHSFPAMVLLCLLAAVVSHAKLPDEFAGWQTGAFRTIPLSQLSQVAGLNGGLLREYGFVAGERRVYAKNEATLTVTSWQMQDVSGSFGLFTFHREPGMQTLEGEDRIAIGKDRVLVQRGLYLIAAEGAPLTLGEAKLLLAEVPSLRNSESLLPSLPAYLPNEGLIADSSKFLLGPVAFERLEKTFPSSALGFDLGAEAVLAHYHEGSRSFRLLLASYPTPQLAAKMLRSFQQLPVVAAAEDGNRIYIQRKGPLVGLVFDSPTPAAAEKLLGRIRYESVVTWNQYIPGPRDNVGDMIWNIFLLAGFLLLFATIAGISFGAFRVLAKKFLPVPIFDRPSQIEIIRLNLSDK